MRTLSHEEQLQHTDSIQGFARLTSQLRQGTQNPEALEKAKRILLTHKYTNMRDSFLLTCLIDDGIFSYYADLYPGQELTKPDNFASNAMFHFKIWDVFIMITWVANTIASPVINPCAIKPMDRLSQIQLFLSLEKIQSQKERDFFIKTAVAMYQREAHPPSKCSLDVINVLNSVGYSTHNKWRAVLRYLTDIKKNYEKPLYRIIADKNRMQDYAGFTQLSIFSLFARQTQFPEDIHTIIKNNFVNLSVEAVITSGCPSATV